MKIKYVVVKLDSSCRGIKEVERFEFSSVIDAIEKHMKVKYYYTGSTSWDLVVEYS